MPVLHPVNGSETHRRAGAGQLTNKDRLTKLLFTGKLQDLYERVNRPNLNPDANNDDRPILEKVLSEMQVLPNVSADDMRRVPKSGAVVVVANHPFGILDGAMLGALMARIRPDVKVLTNFLLAAIPELAPYCIFVDPFNRRESKEANSKGLKQAIAHLRAGGMLVIFPAGEVSHFHMRERQIMDPAWSDTAARLIRKTHAKALPVLFVGRNSLPFHLAGMIHPMLRTAQLPRELFKKVGKKIEVRIGNPISAEKLKSIGTDQEAIQFLRGRTYLLAGRGRYAPANFLDATPVAKVMPKPIPKKLANIADPVPQETIATEIEGLDAQMLDENREFSVLWARAEQIPNALHEIGRLREITFRAVSEGTGKCVDLDRFDAYYLHLILWSKSKQQIAGAYRFANTTEIIAERGIDGLYTATLFEYSEQFFQRMGPALELGRSFICLEFQKQYAPLLMLWRGITRYVARNPQTPVLFGAVSISSEYTRVSREMLVRYFRNLQRHELASMVHPRRGFRCSPMHEWEFAALRHILNADELSESISDVELDGKGIPILLKQYLKMGGSILDFNVDKDFANVLDGLILVDMRKTEPGRLEPYMGKEGLRTFHAHHATVK